MVNKILDAPPPGTAENQETTKAAERAAACKVITVIGSRGGIGTTTIATNLGYTIANHHHIPVAILDPDAHFGTVALALDLEPSRGLRDAIEHPDRVDSLFLERAMVRYDDNLHVLSAEDDFDKDVAYHPEAAETLLQALKENHDCIIVDLPRIINKFTKYILEHANDILLVTELSVAGLRDSMRFCDMIKGNINNSSVTLIANRTSMAKGSEMPRKSFEKNLGHDIRVEHEIPFEPEAFEYANSGKLLATESKKSKMLPVLEAIAAKHFGATENGDENDNKTKKTLASLFKK